VERGQAKKARNKELLMNCQNFISRLKVKNKQSIDTLAHNVVHKTETLAAKNASNLII
jgi:hypothetical protein